MTKITKPVIRETAVSEGTDQVVAELRPKSLVLRLKGIQGSSVELDYAWLRRMGKARQGGSR